jgi:hypothetical protein
MPFLQFLKSLDDLLYELMSWLVFFPVTLWRAIVRPLATMDYADRELGENLERQYDETLSPPQFLLVTLLVSHAIELALVGQSEVVADKAGLAALVKDDTSLLLLRLVIFSLFPLIMAVAWVRQSGIRLTRNSLRDPFYAQCFPVGPLALALGIGTIAAGMRESWLVIGGAVLIVAASIWYGIVQIIWFRRRMKSGWLRALAVALRGLAESMAVAGIVIMLT